MAKRCCSDVKPLLRFNTCFNIIGTTIHSINRTVYNILGVLDMQRAATIFTFCTGFVQRQRHGNLMNRVLGSSEVGSVYWVVAADFDLAADTRQNSSLESTRES